MARNTTQYNCGTSKNSHRNYLNEIDNSCVLSICGTRYSVGL